MKKILLFLLSWVILLNVVNIISNFLIFDKTSYELPSGISLSFRHILVPWLNFDGRNYLQIVNKGYDLGYLTELRVFFPLYPLLIRILSVNNFLNPIIIGLSVSLISLITSLFILNKLLTLDGFKRKDRERLILLILLFPTSFYFLAYYTESLFFLLVVSFFYFLNKKQFFISSVIAFLATATRITGLALLPILFYRAYKEFKDSRKINWSILISPFGFIFYLIYVQLISGDFLSVILKQKEWKRPIGLLGPWYALKDGFVKFIFGSKVTQLDFFGRSMEVVEFIFVVFLIYVIIHSYKKIKFDYWLYLFFSSLPIFFSGALSSIHRYMLVMFPIYVYLFKVIPRKFIMYAYIVFLILLIYFSALFLRNYWVA